MIALARRLARAARRRLQPRPAPDSTATAALPRDFSPENTAICEAVRQFTMTSPERVNALADAVRHVVRREVPGAFVECGVWRGGSSMAIALALRECGAHDRDIFLYDTFEGMSEPTGADVSVWGEDAKDELSRSSRDTGRTMWCYSPLDDVRANMARTGYPDERVHFVQGKVEDTLPGTLPGEIALLRLDTDWYESTRHELVHLFPLLQPGGVLILDDYGYWQGARRAVDEYFAEHGTELLLCRIDSTGRIALNV